MDFVKFLFVIFKVCWFIKSSLAKAHREQIQTRGVLNSYKKSPSVFAYQNKLYKKQLRAINIKMLAHLHFHTFGAISTPLTIL